MPIVPDTKDWTWVLSRRCPQCGFDATQLSLDQVPAALRDTIAAWPAELRLGDVRDRPDASTWSTLEYAAHVRDVFRLFDQRLSKMLTTDDTIFDDWDQDTAAVEGRYGELDPAVVTEELVEAGEHIAVSFESVPPEKQSRTGRRSDGAVFTVESLALYMLHDAVHHAWDVRRG